MKIAFSFTSFPVVKIISVVLNLCFHITQSLKQDQVQNVRN